MPAPEAVCCILSYYVHALYVFHPTGGVNGAKDGSELGWNWQVVKPPFIAGAETVTCHELVITTKGPIEVNIAARSFASHASWGTRSGLRRRSRTAERSSPDMHDNCLSSRVTHAVVGYRIPHHHQAGSTTRAGAIDGVPRRGSSRSPLLSGYSTAWRCAVSHSADGNEWYSRLDTASRDYNDENSVIQGCTVDTTLDKIYSHRRRRRARLLRTSRHSGRILVAVRARRAARGA